jgi:hypothetical protein
MILSGSGNPEVFDFLVSEFLGFRLRGSDEPFASTW